MRRLAFVVTLLTAGLVAGLVIASRLPLTTESHAVEQAAPAASRPATAAPQAPLVTSGPDFTRVAEQTTGAVANIASLQRVRGSASPFANDPFFQYFFGDQADMFGSRDRYSSSLGSGVIISADGYVLTNSHVVGEGEVEVTVGLADKREFRAKVIGVDPSTDLALLKVDAQKLPFVAWGDSSKLKVAEWVMAVGNPFQLNQTVTLGIVSALGRANIGISAYEDFIQTDAAINPGNSGGPLINLRGEVVGINTAIFSRSGGNIGIGFAIPVNLAKELLPQLEEKGKVTRGWLGVLIQKVSPEIAESLGLETAKGALVADVMSDGPAKKAGVEVGDVIVQFDGHAVNDSNELPLLVARTPVGKAVELIVIRDGKRETLSVAIAELEDDGGEVAASEDDALGLTVQPLTPEIAESLGLDETIKGVVVSAVEPGSRADEAGLQRGDVIMEINRKVVADLGDYRKAVRGVSEGKTALLLVRRGDNTIFIPIKP